jgi:hypothetical protein
MLGRGMSMGLIMISGRSIEISMTWSMLFRYIIDGRIRRGRKQGLVEDDEEWHEDGKEGY